MVASTSSSFVKGTTRWVIKIGGSLDDRKTIDSLAKTISRLSERLSFVIVPGGGVYADFVRENCKRTRLTPKTAHAQAVLAATQYGYYLASRFTNGVIVHSKADAIEAIKEKAIPVFMPYPFALDEAKVPASWHATSDTIAAVICRQLGFHGLIVLKSADGILVEGALVPTATKSKATKSGVVDPLFCKHLGKSWKVCIINGQYPARLRELFSTGSTIMTRVVC